MLDCGGDPRILDSDGVLAEQVKKNIIFCLIVNIISWFHFKTF